MAQFRLSSASLRRQLSCSRLVVAISLLLAMTRTIASCMSGWVIIRFSSLDARSMRSLSELSITQISALALSKQCVHKLRNFSCPPTSQTINLTVLKVSSQTLKPMVGMVLMTSPSLSEQRMVVLPAPSRPNITTLHCFLGIFLLKIVLKILPIQILQLGPLTIPLNSLARITFCRIFVSHRRRLYINSKASLRSLLQLFQD